MKKKKRNKINQPFVQKIEKKKHQFEAYKIFPFCNNDILILILSIFDIRHYLLVDQ